MGKRTIIINGLPRPNGNTAYLIDVLRGPLEGEIIEISAFRSGIAPCVDCRGCWETAKCVIQDGMQVIYDDDFDNIVIASPVYYGTLPGSVLSLMSRLQPWHAAMFFLKKPLQLKPKKSAAILTAGGKGNAEHAQHHLSAFFWMYFARNSRAVKQFSFPNQKCPYRRSVQHNTSPQAHPMSEIYLKQFAVPVRSKSYAHRKRLRLRNSIIANPNHCVNVREKGQLNTRYFS